jgi:hypothetical protein
MTGPNPNKQAVELNRALLGASINFVLAVLFSSYFSININLIGVFYVKYWSDSFIYRFSRWFSSITMLRYLSMVHTRFRIIIIIIIFNIQSNFNGY